MLHFSFQEFELLHYSLSSARIFFRPPIQQDEDEEQKQEEIEVITQEDNTILDTEPRHQTNESEPIENKIESDKAIKETTETEENQTIK